MNDVDIFLEHYGVKGMKWGVRNSRPDGVTRKTDRQAKKDASEFARAKMYYGEGAGTRRKLIKNSVEDRKKRDPSYAKAFDKHLADQNMSKHAEKAVSERGKTDRKTRNKQRGGAILRRVTNEPGTQAAIVAAVMGGAAYLNSPNGRRLINKTTNQIRRGVEEAKRRNGARVINNWLKTHS